jgi:hypothetical protein
MLNEEYGLEMRLEVVQSEDDLITLMLTCEDKLVLTMTYTDAEMAQYIITNLNEIISDFLDDAIQDMVSYDIDEELRQLLEEEGNK